MNRVLVVLGDQARAPRLDVFGSDVTIEPFPLRAAQRRPRAFQRRAAGAVAVLARQQDVELVRALSAEMSEVVVSPW